MYFNQLLTFTCIVWMLSLMPGPNMFYILSHTMRQGKAAGLISLLGITTGSCFYILATAFGMTAILMTSPMLFNILKISTSFYLMFLAWNFLKSHKNFLRQINAAPKTTNKKLYFMGLITSLFNPKIAIIYLLLIPPFIFPTKKSIFLQTLFLGGIQIGASIITNTFLIFFIEFLMKSYKPSPKFFFLQSWVISIILIFISIRMLLSHTLFSIL